MKLRKLMAAAMAAMLASGALSALPVQAAQGNVKLDGVSLKTDIMTKSDVRFVPLQFVAESIGAETSYNKLKKEITITTSANALKLTVGKTDYTKNGVSAKLEAAPTLASDVPYVPLSGVLKALGAAVSYDAATKTSVVTYFANMAGSVKITGSTTLQPIVQTAADKLNGGKLTISVAGGGSGAGVNDTIAGTNNLGMSSRELTDEEAGKISSIAVANDGIAIIVNPSNPVKNLTAEQARKIFLGEIKNWKDVGGSNAPILVATRETGSGTRSTFEEMLLAKKPVVSTATPYTSSALIKQAVSRDKNAIGFDSVGFVDKTVKALSIDSVAPTSETVKSGDYIMGRSLYILVKGTPSGASALFVDYLRTKACQDEIVVKEGYISIY